MKIDVLEPTQAIMRRKAALAGLVAVVLLLSARGLPAMAAPGEARDGECIAKLDSDSRQLELPLSHKFRLVSRGSKAEDRFYLASNATLSDVCGRKGQRTVFDTLQIPPTGDLWVSVSMDCSSSVATSIHRGTVVVGQFEKKDGSLGAIARQAWIADLRNRRFRPVDKVICHSFDQ